MTMNNSTLEKEWTELEANGLLEYDELTQEQEDALYDEFLEETKDAQSRNSYVEAVCVGAPLGLPEYNEATEQWEVAFEESPTDWHPLLDDRDILFVSCEDSEEACNIYNYYLQNPVELKQDDEIPNPKE